MNELLINVENGRIGLPDLQRPFEWNDSQVRNLLDSMMRGYPIGFIMLWSSPDKYENVGYIGENDKTYDTPENLVIDGQQRLTALLAAMHGVIVRDKNVDRYRKRLGEERYKETCLENALPLNFEKMDYEDFLAERRVLMAQKVRGAYVELSK